MREKNSYEFTIDVKQEARRRANGRCEGPVHSLGCSGVNDNRVGHFTGIGIARRLGLEPSSISSIENTLMLSEACSKAFDRQERRELEMVEEERKTGRRPDWLEIQEVRQHLKEEFDRMENEGVGPSFTQEDVPIHIIYESQA